ncbi:zinc finger protein 6-like [Impatiens glandulifera]|uniref:zinc finger protein 6-like n=1 Tax=Impatiens glandulifera TaxID=253017 RepID=UPI001FB0EAFA|nr:zinc finger protein 6-like [Impatiens glandulifera]
MEGIHEVKEGDDVVEGPTTGSEPVLNMEPLSEHNPVGSSVLDSSSLLEENKVELPSQKRFFSCDYCNLSFSDFRALGGHQTLHKRERDLVNKEFELHRTSPLRLRYTNKPFPLGFQMGSYTNGPPFNGSNNHNGSIFLSFSSPRSPIMPHNYVSPQPLYSSRFRSTGVYHANINGGGGSGSGGGNNINIAPPFRFPGSIRNHGGGVSRYLSEPLNPHGNSTMDAGFLNLVNGSVEGDGGGELDLDLKL